MTVARLSAVLPVHSEIESLAPLADSLARDLGARLYEMIFIVSPASPPATLAALDAIRRAYPVARVDPQARNPGLGFAVRQGLAAARGDAVLLMDTDGEMDAATVPRLVAEMDQSGCDLVVASRWMKGGGAVGYDPIKLVLNRGFQVIFRRLYRTRIHDLTFGFKLIRGADAARLPWNSQFHEIGVETTLRPLGAGCVTREVPTVWRRRATGVSKNTFRRNFRYVAKALELLPRPSRAS